MIFEGLVCIVHWFLNRLEAGSMSEESQLLVASGSGIQTVIPQLTITSPQIPYQNFDGVETPYNGEFLTIDKVTAAGSNLEKKATSSVASNGQTGNSLSAESKPATRGTYVPGTWGDNLEDAKAYAKAHNVPIFVYYGDPSWCTYCRYLEAQVFQAEDFLEYANSGSVVLLDNVDISGLSYSGVPTCFLLDADGNVLSQRVGFGSGTHDAWMNWFDDYVTLVPTDQPLNYVPGTWGDNFEDAKAYAKAHDVPIFVYYGDPSWCGPCRNLEAEVFEAEDFQQYANYGCVVLLDNVPIDGLAHPSIPTCYILDADGNVLSKRVGYGSGSHDSWMAWFKPYVLPIPDDLDFVKVYSSGTLISSSIMMSGGTLGSNMEMMVSSGGRALSTKINNGGSMSVQAGGATSDTEVNSGGSLVASLGAILGGTTVVGGDLVVSGSVTAANIVFAVNQRTTSDGYILNDLAALHADSISVRVNGAQGYGCYKLAANATGFNGTITVWNSDGSVSYGTISVSSPVCVGMTCYSLSATSSGLDFIVEKNPNVLSSGSAVQVYSSGLLTAMADTLSGINLVSGDNDSMVVSSGGVVMGIQIQSGGTMRISSGGVANETTMSGYYNYYSSTFHNIYASAYIEKGGSASGFSVGSCASLYVSSGARLSNVSISGWGGDVVIYSGASVNGVILDYSGALFISSGGRVENVSYKGAGHRSLVVTISGGDSKTYVQGVNAQGKEFTIQNGVGSNLILYANYFGGYVNVKSGGVLKDTIVSGGYLNISSGGIASNTTIDYSFNGITLSRGAIHSGTINMVKSGGMFKVSSGGIINFSVNERTVSDGALITNLAYITGTPTYTLTMKPDQASGTYKLATNAAAFDQSVSVCTTEGTCFGAITVGDYFCTDDTCYSLTLNDNGILNFNVMSRNAKPGNPDGDDEELSWTAVEGASGYVVEYSQDNFATCIIVETDTVGMEHYNVGAGTWQWRVRTNGGLAWTIGNNVVVSDKRAGTNVVSATADGVKDTFFVKPQGTWDSTFRARHMGVNGVWEGTGEKVVFGGENRFGDIFQGSTDENVLLLTDDANGDALFVYDTFTESKDDMAKSQSRLSNIKEIRAGAGNDIVDLTSDQFDYTGGGLSIHGGLGDDTIWANAGNNTLFGDAGNDRLVGASGDDVIVGGLGNDSMHGGGGNDIFAFGGNWGKDTVEQLADGKVTLWFDNNSSGNWDAATLTYTDGENSVKVSGVTAEDVTLKFGDDGSAQYGKLLKIGAFDEFSSERIFENKNTRGMLA